jgi:hypothetical protein
MVTLADRAIAPLAIIPPVTSIAAKINLRM